MTALKQIAVRLPPDLIAQLDEALGPDESRNARIAGAIERDIAPTPNQAAAISDVRSPEAPVIARVVAPISRQPEAISPAWQPCIHCRTLSPPPNGEPCHYCGQRLQDLHREECMRNA